MTPESAARIERIVKMRGAHLSFAEIGARESISAVRASEIYREALARTPTYAIDEHRAEQQTLIDTAINRLMAIAANPNETSSRTRVEAWNSIRGWAERRAKLLGLDAPIRTETITLDAITAEIRSLEAELDVKHNFEVESA